MFARSQQSIMMKCSVKVDNKWMGILLFFSASQQINVMDCSQEDTVNRICNIEFQVCFCNKISHQGKDIHTILMLFNQNILISLGKNFHDIALQLTPINGFALIIFSS
ncbi:unnamed protein product (macronuclear) [Paramecium tetraurelia]|uniref:Uncharacterized protein n=1 Tax=Paramecium tetraurelia TaxID=5888 RepID=A0BVR5_PARTE|nr:uncharacterized protein GSPATT00032484001 [Paramecium tetraurelia]CAK62632.1 unnamed protein product [Paramecium tetraurelia]|eukprot:XP_001430030.1 hypothetical protein (macronuclear) [Paramecium tetraurelia strain d4-2]